MMAPPKLPRRPFKTDREQAAFYTSMSSMLASLDDMVHHAAGNSACGDPSCDAQRTLQAQNASLLVEAAKAALDRTFGPVNQVVDCQEHVSLVHLLLCAVIDSSKDDFN